MPVRAIATALGPATFVAGGVIDAERYRSGEIGGGKLALNTGVGIYGLVGGVPGAIVAGAYGLTEYFFPGALDAAGSSMSKHHIQVELNRLKYGHGPKY